MIDFKKIISFIKKHQLSLIIFAALSFAISLTFQTGFSVRYSYKLNDIANEPIIAPFDFGILKTDIKLEKDLDDAKKSVPYSFNRDQLFVQNQLAQIDTLFLNLNNLNQSYLSYQTSQDSLYKYRYEPEFEIFNSSFIADSTTFYTLYKNFLEKYPFQIEKSRWDELLSINESFDRNIDLVLMKNTVKQTCLNRWAEGILDESLGSIISTQISIIQGGELVLSPVSNFNDIEKAWKKNKEEVRNIYPDELSIEHSIAYEIINELSKPNVRFDKSLTEKNQKEKLDKVSRFQGTVLANELIVDKNNGVTELVILKIRSLQLESSKRLGYEKATDKFREYLGAFFVVLLLLSLLYAFLFFYRTNFLKNFKKITLIGFLIYGIVFLSWLITNYSVTPYIIPIALVSILATVLLDATTSVVMSTILIFLVSLLVGNDFDFTIIQFFICFVAILNVRNLRKRRQIISTMFSLVFSSLLIFFSLMIFKGVGLQEINLSNMGYLALASFISPIFAFGLIPLFEPFFGITTDISLIELLDYDQPLLKRLMEDAPGTHTHSVKVGTLAESCAKAIGARALLCRVGSYYHDIGKVMNPEYFAENQSMGINKHDNLGPEESVAILKQHVEDGLKLAKEYSLPPIVTDFIATHHAKNRMEFFYQKARELSSESEKIQEEDFRYSGPKPRTKETAIVMIAEAIEAQANSISNPTIEKFEEMIDQTIKSRLDDGQLDECPLTMDDLRKIKGRRDGKNGLLPSLAGLYHSRTEYKKND